MDHVVWKLPVAALLVLLSLSCGSAETPDRSIGSGDSQLQILHVQGGVYVLASERGNATVQVGDQGVLLVDTLEERLSQELLAAVESLSDLPIRHIINTSAHPAHTGGNAAAAVAGDSLFNVGGQADQQVAYGGDVDEDFTENTAPIYAHENVLMTIVGQSAPMNGWPSSTYFTERKVVFFNGEAVEILHQPNAHSDGDSIVFFRRSDVISTGKIFSLNQYPVVDVEQGGTVAGIIDALNVIVRLAVPEALQEGGTMVIPGDGRLGDQSEVVEYRDMLTIIRSMIQERINEGMSLEEVQADRPTSGFDGRFASNDPDWTPQMFVEIIYNELAR